MVCMVYGVSFQGWDVGTLGNTLETFPNRLATVTLKIEID